MQTYSRWKNANPRDSKIDDAEMARFMLLVATIPVVTLGAWALAVAEGVRLAARGHAGAALAYVLLTPFFTLGELPSYLRARWLNITG